MTLTACLVVNVSSVTVHSKNIGSKQAHLLTRPICLVSHPAFSLCQLALVEVDFCKLISLKHSIFPIYPWPVYTLAFSR